MGSSALLFLDGSCFFRLPTDFFFPRSALVEGGVFSHPLSLKVARGAMMGTGATFGTAAASGAAAAAASGADSGAAAAVAGADSGAAAGAAAEEEEALG